MPQILIRDVDEGTLSKLKGRAARNDRSLQAELRLILQRAATDVVEGRTIAARIRRKLGNRKRSDSTALVAKDRRR